MTHEQRHRLADAWAGCLVEVDDAVFWIKLAIMRGEVPTARHVAKYAEHVRMVSEYEDMMRAQDIEFIRDVM